MQIGTFKGLPVIAFPSVGLVSVALDFTDSVTVNTGSFTQQTQTYLWPGGDLISGSIHWPPMARASGAQVSSFLMECRGMAACFLLQADPNGTPTGTPTGAPVVAGAVAALSTTLTTRGWTPSTPVLGTGDWIQLGAAPTNPTATTAWAPVRLHCVLSDVISDASGNATFNIFPSIRESIADGTVVVTDCPSGLFRLATNDRTINLAPSPASYTASVAVKEFR